MHTYHNHFGGYNLFTPLDYLSHSLCFYIQICRGVHDTYMYTRVFKMFNKNFNRFRNVRKMENAAGLLHEQNGGIGVCLYIGETNLAFPRTLYESGCHQRWIPRGSDTSACPCVWLGSVGVLCQTLEARNNSVGRIRIRIWEAEMGVTATTTLFPHTNSRLHLRTLSHFAPWNKPIHGLELFQFATVPLVLPTHANTLDRSQHFESGTFLNRRHYCDVWYSCDS